MKLICLFAINTAVLLMAQREPVFPPGSSPIGPYSPGIIFENVLYVSGQGARDAKGNLPVSPEDQTRQSLANIREIVENAKFSMANVVYTHTYLTDMNSYAAVNKVYPEVFPGTLPARSTMGVSRMPLETPVEISAIAVRGTMRAVTLPNAQSPVPISPGIIAADRFFLSGILGRDAEANITPASGSAQIDLCLSRIGRVLAAAKISSDHLVYLNVYRTSELRAPDVESRFRKAFPEAAISVIEASALPFGVQVGVTGIAAMNIAQKRVHRQDGKVICAAVSQTIYCASQSVDTAGEALRVLGSALQSMGSSLTSALSANVYMNDITAFPNMNAVYALQFARPFPTRTTVQPQGTGVGKAVTISVVAQAVKSN